jgi:hypothetical protein
MMQVTDGARPCFAFVAAKRAKWEGQDEHQYSQSFQRERKGHLICQAWLANSGNFKAAIDARKPRGKSRRSSWPSEGAGRKGVAIFGVAGIDPTF